MATQCQCKICDSVNVCRKVLLMNTMFDDRCGNHTTMVNPKINSPHFPLIQKSASRGAKTLRRERSMTVTSGPAHKKCSSDNE